jgi:hypothetical protein
VNEPLAADVIAKHRAMTRRYMIAKDLVPYLGINPSRSWKSNVREFAPLAEARGIVTRGAGVSGVVSRLA